MDIKHLVKDRYVEFAFYRSGFFYYNIIVVNFPENYSSENLATRDIYQFPVPIEDIGNATLLKNDKAITYMRWIRKAVGDGTLMTVKP